MYFEGFLPFVQEMGYMENNKRAYVNVDDVFCPLISNTLKTVEDFEKDIVFNNMISKKTFRILHVEPIGVKVFLENDSLSYYAKRKFSGQSILANVTTIEYGEIAKQMTIENGVLRIPKNGGFIQQEDILTDLFVISAANGIPVNTQPLYETLTIPLGDRVSLYGAFEPDTIKEAATQADFDEITQGFLKDKKLGAKVEAIDFIYEWMNAYFQLPEGQDMVGQPITGGAAREVVPLLIGPTGVFKSATVKTLCEKFNFRFVDFRVAFTSKLDYSGVYKVVGDYSYACPMEELAVCSDGFREYCKKAIIEIEKTLKSGELVVSRSSTGNDTVEEKIPLEKLQMDILTKLLADYNDYARIPVLFFDEITRNKNKGVEGVLTTLLNQKRFNNMTLKSCKFVAATNVNLGDPTLNDIYDVSDDIDTAYANRFLRLAVYPKAVQSRWVDWANKNKKDKSIPNMIPILMTYLKSNTEEIYNEDYVVKVFTNALVDPILEASCAPFPNYRTWELVSNYLYSIDSTKIFNKRIIAGIIGEGACGKLLKFLVPKGYSEEVEKEDTDDVGKFLADNLRAGLPAMLIGPSSLGKTSRVNNYAKAHKEETGIDTEIIHINLSSMDNVDVMGYPTAQKITAYISTDTSSTKEIEKSFRQFNKDLESVLDDVVKNSGTGLPDSLTIRAADKTIKDRFVSAIKDKKDIILFFDECNRVTNTSIMSCMFEAISDCLVGDTKVPLLDGRVLTMREIHEEFQKDRKSLWVYSCTKEGKIVPGKVSESRVISGDNKQLVKVTLDSGDSVVCTDYHPWMLRSGEYARADELQPDTSLMPLYTKLSSKKEGDCIDGYIKVLDNETGEWMKEHHKNNPEIAKKFNKAGIAKTTENWKNEEYKNKMIKIHRERSNNEEFKSLMRENATRNNSNPEIKEKQQIGKITQVVFKSLNIYGFVTEMSYEATRREYFPHGYVGYTKAMRLLNSLGIEDISKVALNYNHKVVSVERLEYKEDVYDISVDDYHNFAVDAGVFVHNSRIFGIDFKDYKEHVKIIAACNLGEDYTGAKELDSALAARFCTYWKKGYDLKDTKSFLEFLKSKLDAKPPEIDGLLYNFLKEMPEKQLLEYLKSVEARTIENATPSSRMMFQLSTDIKNMRGNKTANGEFQASVFNGTVLFDTISRNKRNTFIDIVTKDNDMTKAVPIAIELVSYINKASARWDAKLTGKTIEFRGKQFTVEDTLNYLNSINAKIQTLMMTSDKEAIKDQLNLMSGIFDAVVDLDDKVVALRKDVFESYGGPQFAKDFLPYFNERFGSASDIEITIEMLDDINLYPDFFKRKIADITSLTPDLKITEMISLIDKYSDYWGDKLSPTLYSAFLSGVISGMPTTSNTMLLLKTLSSKQDPFMVRAEAVGDSFIKDVLKIYPKSISDAQITQYRTSASTPKNNTTKKTRLI